MDLPLELVYHCQLQSQSQLKKEVLAELLTHITLADPDCDQQFLCKSMFSNIWTRPGNVQSILDNYKVNWGRAVPDYQSYVATGRGTVCNIDKRLIMRNIHYVYYKPFLMVAGEYCNLPPVYYMNWKKQHFTTNYWGEPLC